MTKETFVVHANPGPLLTLVADATQCQIAAAKEQHKRKLKLFKEKRFVERSFKIKLINAFDKTCLMHDTKLIIVFLLVQNKIKPTLNERNLTQDTPIIFRDTGKNAMDR